MAFTKTSTAVGMPSITSTISSTDYIKTVPLGTIIQATDPTYGTGEFIYLEGVASTVVGSIVTYDDSFQTALASTALNAPRPVAVAMSANIASQYGWYQISGIAVATKANTTSYAKGAALAAGSGLAIAAASGLQISGALVAVVASAKSNVTTVNIMIDRPHGPRN